MSAPGVDLIVPRELVRATGRLAGAQVFVSASLPLNATVGAVAAKRLSGHEGLAGTSVGIAFLFSMLSLYVVGSVAQNLGRKPVLLAGLSLLALGALICGLAIWAGSYALFVVGTAIFGTGQGPSTLGRAAAADLYPPMLRGRGVGTVATAGAIGAVVGPLIAIAAGGGAAGARHRALGGAVPRRAAARGGRRLADRPHAPRSARGRVRSRPLVPQAAADPRAAAAAPRAELMRLGPARAAITATALGQAAMVGVMSITSVELGDHGWADWQVQLLMAAHFVGMFALAYPVGMLADRIGRRRTSLLGLGACAVGSFGTAITGASPLITPFFFLLGLGWAGCFVAGTSILADITSPRERGVLTASNDLIVALCAAAASISAGVLLSGAGYWAVGVVFGTLLLLAVPGLLRLQEPTVGVYVERAGGRARRHGPSRACGSIAARSALRRRRCARPVAAPRLFRRGLARCARGARAGRRARAGSAGEMPVARSTASGNLAGCAVASATSGASRAALRARPAVRPTAVCGSSSVPLRRYSARIASSVASSSSDTASKSSRTAASAAASSVSEPGLRESRELARGALGIAPVELEEQALEVRRDLDVHARAERGHDAARLQAAAREQARQDVVGVRADHEPLERQARTRARPSPRARCRSCRWARRTRARGRRARSSPTRSTRPARRCAPS